MKPRQKRRRACTIQSCVEPGTYENIAKQAEDAGISISAWLRKMVQQHFLTEKEDEDDHVEETPPDPRVMITPRNFPDAFAVLDLGAFPNKLTQTQVEKKRRELMLQNHPDHHGGDIRYTEAAKNILLAAEILKDRIGEVESEQIPKPYPRPTPGGRRRRR